MDNEQALNKKMAEWAGIHHYPNCKCISGKPGSCWGITAESYGINGNWHFVLPSFTTSLDACFKWLVPKLYHSVHLYHPSHGGCFAELSEWGNEERIMGHGSSVAEGLCLAIEKLIDETTPKGEQHE